MARKSEIRSADCRVHRGRESHSQSSPPLKVTRTTGCGTLLDYWQNYGDCPQNSLMYLEKARGLKWNSQSALKKHFLIAYILALSKRKKQAYISAQKKKEQYDLNYKCVQCAIKQERKMALLDLDLVS